MADEKQFLNDIQSADANVRFGAWRSAGEMSPSVIPELGKLAASKDPGIAKAAREALTTMTHSVGKDPAAPNRAGVVKGLLDIKSADAFRLLSHIAGEDSVPAIAKSIGEPGLREEVVYCLERIPGPAADKALIAAYKDAAAEFKPRILAALGHRRSAEAVELCADAARSASQPISLAGVKAFGRIGKKPTSPVKRMSFKDQPLWDRIDETDSMLRYADAQAKEGNTAEAMRIYKTALAAPEEHWQCAAIIGLAKIGTAEAAVAILPKLKSENRTVRITASNAWKSMAG
jgi:HEAT repeat protein